MQSIATNITTLYADLLQFADPVGGVLPATIKTKKIKGTEQVYASVKHGATRIEQYLGPKGSDEVERYAQSRKQAQAIAKDHQATITMLRRAGMLAPPVAIGRIFEVLSRAGLFQRGLVLSGTHAFRLYPLALGVTWPGAAFATNDIDISAASFAEAGEPIDLGEVLARASDNGIEPQWHTDLNLPARFMIGTAGLDVITRSKRGRKSPVAIDALNVAAEALPFQEYLTERTFDVIALYGSGVRIRIPEPARFAVHKLIVAQRRPARDVKRQKDLDQAKAIRDALEFLGDEHEFETALEDAQQRGRAWRRDINASLKEL